MNADKSQYSHRLNSVRSSFRVFRFVAFLCVLLVFRRLFDALFVMFRSTDPVEPFKSRKKDE